MDMLSIEKKYWNKDIRNVAGIDEAGRGPLAGPVVAACVVFDVNVKIDDIKDSKKLTAKKRDLLFDTIYEKAKYVTVGIVHEDEIDRVNILQATYLAMKITLGKLDITPGVVLVDGPRSNIKHYKVKHVINGDNLSQSIAAASIIAKVTRDRMMKQYDIIFPEYKFSNHKGYGTKYHTDTIKDLKSTPIHRKSFKIVKSNLPSIDFVKNSYGFSVLGTKIVASEYIKKGYVITADLLEGKKNKYFDFCFMKSEKYFFIKILTFVNSNKDKIKNNLYSDNLNYIETLLDKKDMRINFTFDVISITFQKNKKPLIEIIYKKTND